MSGKSNALVIRRKRKYKSPNPLFEQWLTEWRDSAAEKGQQSKFIYGKALSSLKKYPLPLSTGKEAKILEFFGDKICMMLDEKLVEHKAQLAQHGESSSASTEETISPVVSHALNLPAVKKKAITSKKETSENVCSIVLPSLSSIETTSPEDSEEFVDSFTLTPGTFEIVLCVDNMETCTGSKKSKQQFLSELQKSGSQFEVRKLHVGDFLWIAQEKASSSNPSRELVLDFVVERKRLDDLSHSIKDGRFREQKFRLRNCGVRQPVYLVEYHSGHKFTGIPETTLEQAIVNTQVVDNFIVKRTRDIKESVAFLSSITRHLNNTLLSEALTSGTARMIQNSNFQSRIFLTFQEFNKGSVKNKRLVIREMFAKQLLQFHGLSVDRALAVVDRFKTPSRFLESLQSCSSEEDKIKMLAELKYGKSQRNFGAILAKTVLQFYWSS